MIEVKVPKDAYNIGLSQFCGIWGLHWNDSNFPEKSTGLNIVNSSWLGNKQYKIKEIKPKLVIIEEL